MKGTPLLYGKDDLSEVHVQMYVPTNTTVVYKKRYWEFNNNPNTRN